MSRFKNPSFRQLYAFGNKLPIDLSLSENPLGCSPRVSAVLKNIKQKNFFDYPDSDSTILRKVLSRRFGLSTDNFFVANGSEAIIKLLPQVFLGKKDNAIIPKITFPMFEIAVRLCGSRVLLSDMAGDFDIDLKDIQSKVTDNTKLIFLCNPNNPTGRLLKKREVLKLISVTKAIVVVDEANIEFGGQSVIREIKRFDNLIVLRTFSKGFGLAGLRIGFACAGKQIIGKLRKFSQPFPVSSVAQMAAVISIQDKGFIQKTKEFLASERDFLTQSLQKRGFRVVESKANNMLVLINKEFGSSIDFVRRLNVKGVSVVDGRCFNDIGKEFIRICPRLKKVNRQFIRVIDKIVSKDILNLG